MTDHVRLRPPIEVDGTTYFGGEVHVSHDGHPFVWRVWTNDDRYPDRSPEDHGQFLIHGHVHQAWKANGRQVNVGWDVWHKPIPEDELIELLDSI